MKKIIAGLFVFVLFLTGCTSQSGDAKSIPELKVTFVPSAPAEKILKATEPLGDMLKEELAKAGYTVDKVSVDVGTDYTSVGEALASGSTDIGMVPGGTYVMYKDDGVEAALTATRKGLSKDFDDAKSWNDGKATENTSEEATSYRSIIVAGPSEYGKTLSDKINNGQKLTFEDINKANICVQDNTSSSGYLYPAQMTLDLFNKKITDFDSIVTVNGYGDALGRIANGQCDIAPMYGDARMDYVKEWTSTYGREKSIWEETNVIGVSEPIMNDTVSVSKNSDIMTDELEAAIQQAFINIGKTPEGKKVIAIYSHEGYQIANPDDYALEKEVQDNVVNA